MRTQFITTFAVILILGSVLFLRAYAKSNSDDVSQQGMTTHEASSTVTTQVVKEEAFRRSVTASGSVAPWQEVTISSESSGLRLAEMSVVEGEWVRKDQILARLDSDLLAAQLAEQEAVIQEATATLERANSTAARGERLLASRTISAETAEERETKVKTSRAQLAQAEAVARRIRVQLDRTSVRAPFDGTVASKPAVVGSTVQVGTVLLSLIREGRLEVEALVSDKEIALLHIGQKAKIVSPSGERFEGEVSLISQKVDPATRLGTVHITVPRDSGLRAGMFAVITIETAMTSSLSVAQSSVIWRGGKACVFVVEPNGKVTLRTIIIGEQDQTRIAVTSGVSEGEVVVTSGAAFLSEGSLVRVAGSVANAAGTTTGQDLLQ